MYQDLWMEDMVEGSMLKDEIMFNGGHALYEGASETANAKVFQSWLAQAAHGIVGGRFNNSYPDRQVDCWVRFERFKEDTRSCLRVFELQGGSVNWQAVKDSLDKSSTATAAADADADGWHPEKFVGAAAAASSSACEGFYDTATADLVRLDEAFLFDAFNYKCCDSAGATSTNEPHFKSYANPTRARYFFADKVEWEKAGIGGESAMVQQNLASFKNPKAAPLDPPLDLANTSDVTVGAQPAAPVVASGYATSTASKPDAFSWRDAMESDAPPAVYSSSRLRSVRMAGDGKGSSLSPMQRKAAALQPRAM